MFYAILPANNLLDAMRPLPSAHQAYAYFFPGPLGLRSVYLHETLPFAQFPHAGVSPSQRFLRF